MNQAANAWSFGHSLQCANHIKFPQLTVDYIGFYHTILRFFTKLNRCHPIHQNFLEITQTYLHENILEFLEITQTAGMK